MDLFGEPEPAASTIEANAIIANEPDQSLKLPREMEFCLGHEAQEQKLLQLFKDGKLPHAFVFSGPHGIGKSTFAFRFARFLFKNAEYNPQQESLLGEGEGDMASMDVAKDDPVFRQIASGGHPDLFVVQRAYDATKNKTKDSVAVNEIRKIAPFLRMTASYGGWRVVIVDDADTMNRNAQNAILKILEEPPAKTILMLITHRLGALIPTIRSRVQVLNFNTLSCEAIETLLEKENIHPERELFDLAQGSISKALKYEQESALEMVKTILSLSQSEPDWGKIHTLSDQLHRGGYDMFEQMSLWVFETTMRTKARGGGHAAIADNTDLQPLIQKHTLEHLISVYDALKNHFDETRHANLDKRNAVLQACSIMVN